jgi:hypothetical protein
MEPISTFSLAAALAYVVTAVLALACALAATRRPHRAAIRDWIAVALVFLALAGWRIANGEAQVQTFARNWAQMHGTYDDRHEWQAPITIGVMLVVAVLGIAAVRWAGSRASGRALCLAGAMVLLAVLRVVSLHAVDEILYRALGPFHLNYVLDLGLTGLVAALALADRGWLGTGGPAGPPSRRRGSGGHRRR